MTTNALQKTIITTTMIITPHQLINKTKSPTKCERQKNDYMFQTFGETEGYQYVLLAVTHMDLQNEDKCNTVDTRIYNTGTKRSWMSGEEMEGPSTP
jgi:hypothetical protein